MLREFRDFLMRGNVVDLAVAFIAGVVFNAVVQSLVNDVVLQFVAAVVGKPDFSGIAFAIDGTDIRVGAFLTALVSFLLTMAAVFFGIVKPINFVTNRIVPAEPVAAPALRECPECLSEIPVAARRCRYCTATISVV